MGEAVLDALMDCLHALSGLIANKGGFSLSVDHATDSVNCGSNSFNDVMGSFRFLS